MNHGASDRIFVASQAALALGLLIAVRQSAFVASSQLRQALAIALAVSSFALAAIAYVQLKPSFQVPPSPREGVQLIRRGVYGKLRHPMYNAVRLLVAGVVVWRPSVWTLSMALANLCFYVIKTKHEERLLSERYDDYDSHRTQTIGVLPGL